MSPEDINEGAEVLGKQIWRIVPYAKKYPKRVFTGFLRTLRPDSRPCPLLPSVLPLIISRRTCSPGPQIVQDMVTTLHSNRPSAMVSSFSLASSASVCQGISEYAWQTLATTFNTT